MSELLDQTEVDALLAALGSSGVDASCGSRSLRVLPTRSPDVQVFDFKRPERVSKDQLRSLEVLHEGFSGSLGASLSGYLRASVGVTVSHVRQLTYGEFIDTLPNPTCFNLLSAEQFRGQFCLEISPLIVYPIIDRLLGGSSGDLFIPQRPLTQIEQRLIQRVTDRCTHHLSECWSAVSPVTFRHEKFESNPQRVQIVPPNETVIIVAFELKIGYRAGTMALCMPYSSIEATVERMSQAPWFDHGPSGNDGVAGEEKLKRALACASVELRAVLARTTITMEEMVGLRPGDLLTTEKPVESTVTIQVEGRPKFLGRLGQFRGNRAVRITRIADAEGNADPCPAGSTA